MDKQEGGFVKTLEAFEEHLTRHGWTTSREEQRPRDKPLIKQTVTARQGEFLARATYTRREVKDDADQIDFNYSGAYAAPEADKIRWCMFRNEEDLMRFVHEYDTTLLVPSGPRSASGRRGSKCRCRRVRHASEEIADRVLKKIRRERQRMGTTRRLEERVYVCPTDSSVFHLTSLKDWADDDKERKEKTDGRHPGDEIPGRVGAVRPSHPIDGMGHHKVGREGRREAALPQDGDSSTWSLPRQNAPHEEDPA